MKIIHGKGVDYIVSEETDFVSTSVTDPDVSLDDIDSLRFNGEAVISGRGYSEFYIDQYGQKHIVQHNKSWQKVSCSFDDELELNGDTWIAFDKEKKIIKEICAEIDKEAGAARVRFATESPFIEVEYTLAYQDAVRWIDSGYAGDCPESIKSDAEADGRTEKEAALTVKAMGDAWYGVIKKVRDLRLKGKRAVENAPKDADRNQIAAGFISQLKALHP